MNDIFNLGAPVILLVVAPCVFINLLFSLLKWAINTPYERDVHTTTKKWFYE